MLTKETAVVLLGVKDANGKGVLVADVAIVSLAVLIPNVLMRIT